MQTGTYHSKTANIKMPLKYLMCFTVGLLMNLTLMGQSLNPGFYSTGPLFGVSSSAGLALRNPVYKLSNGNYVMSGWSSSNSAFNFVKVDHNWNLVTIKELSNLFISAHRFVEQLSDESLVAVGQSRLTVVENLSLIRMDVNLNQVWSRTYSFSGRDFTVNEVHKCTNDNILVIGGYFNGSVFVRQILRIDHNTGNIINSYSFQANITLGCVSETANGDIFIWAKGTIDKVLLYKFNSSLNLVSVKEITLTLPSGSINFSLTGCTMDSDGNLWAKFESLVPQYSGLIKYNPLTEGVVFAKSTTDALKGVFAKALEGDGMIINSGREKFQKFSNNLTPIWAKEAILPLSEGASAGYSLDYVTVEGNYYIMPHAASASRDHVLKISSDGTYNTSCLPQNNATNSTFLDFVFTESFLALPATVVSTPTTITSEFVLGTAPSSTVVLRTVCANAFPPEICTNGIDDDGDGLVDCDDPDCNPLLGPTFTTGVYTYGHANSFLSDGFDVLPSGNIVMTAYTSTNQHMVIITNSVGTVLQSKTVTIGGSGIVHTQRQPVVALPDGNLVVCFLTSSNVPRFVKFDSNLNIIWSKELSTPVTNIDMKLGPDGNIYFHDGIRVGKLTQAGSLIFLKAWITQSISPGLAIQSDGVIVCGINSNTADYLHIAKIDFSGNLVFSRRSTTTFSSSYTKIVMPSVDKNDNIYITTLIEGSTTNPKKILALDPTATNLIWGGDYTMAAASFAFQFQSGVESFDGTKMLFQYMSDFNQNGIMTVDKATGDIFGILRYPIVTANQYDRGPILKKDNAYFALMTGSNSSSLVITGSDGQLNATGCSASNGNPISKSISNVTFTNDATAFTDNNSTLANVTLSYTNTTVTTNHCVGLPLQKEICTNTLDDDGDGLIDSADPDCACQPVENCSNGIDDDGDGLVDCDDPDCSAPNNCGTSSILTTDGNPEVVGPITVSVTNFSHSDVFINSNYNGVMKNFWNRDNRNLTLSFNPAVQEVTFDITSTPFTHQGATTYDVFHLDVNGSAYNLSNAVITSDFTGFTPQSGQSMGHTITPAGNLISQFPYNAGDTWSLWAGRVRITNNGNPISQVSIGWDGTNNNAAGYGYDILIPNCPASSACSASCDKIPNVAYVFGVDEVDPIGNNNRDNADLKLGSCTCDLNPIAYDVQCNNNGTPNNPADDTYTITNFIVTAAAGGGAGGYNLSGGITASGNAYGTAYSYGPFPISGGPLSVTVTDVNTTSCTRTDQIIPPLTCSNCMVTGTATGDIVCEGESIYLMSSGGDMYSWSGPNGFTSTLQSPVIPNATLAMGGTYTVVVTNTTGGGCTDTKTATVTVNAAPLVTLGADIETCLDDMTTLTATGCSGALLWNTGESSNTISVSPSQTSAYSVQCTASGCVGKDTIIVYVSDITVKGTPTACKPNSSTHDVSVVVTVVNPPISGTLTLTIGGMSQVFNAPFTSPITHNFIDLASDGQYHTIQATLSNGASCSESQFYLAPSPCTTCDITSMTATPGTCNPLTNQYILTGTISTSNPPSSGNLIISTNGVATTIPGPFSATINYEIAGLVSDGMSHDVTAYFTDDLSCVFSTNYLSPMPCNSITCDISLTRSVGTCDVNNNLYSLQGMVTFTGAPETGTLVVVVEGEGSLTYLPPFVSPISYNFPNLTSDGGTKNVTAYFTGNGACFDEVSYTAPARCGNFNCNIRLSMEVGVCDPNTNTYAVTGEVYINNPPSGGNIIISYPGGQQTVANTGVSPVSFQIPGLPASGGIGEIGVTMSNDLPCYTRSIYEIPESCGMISLCSISATASASPCDPERNDYTLTGTLTFSNAPASNIILEIDGITHTIAGPVSSPLMYEIPGMPSDGSDHQLLVYFENNANCSNSVTYTAPAVCAPNTCTMSMNLVTGTCQSATNTFSVSGSLTVSNAPASGQLRIWIEGTGFETVINAPFGANIPFSFSNMVSTGLPYDIKASFSADLSCQVRRSFVAPDACLSGGGCEVQVLAAAACTSGATFTVTGMVLIQNAPSSGTMTIRVGTLLQTLSAPFDPMAFIGFSGFPLGTDVPGEITFSADPSCSVITMVAAPQDCNCEVSLGTVSGLCVEGTETHNARGTVTLVNPPLTGTLTISVPGGQSEVFTAPFNSPLYYEVTGLPDGGGSRTVTAAFSADAGCTATQSYTAPLDCPICDIQLPVVQSLSCYNNDTPSKITDNKIRIRLLVTNANPALTTYNLTVNGGTTISPALGQYGVSTEFTMGPGTAGGGATFIITIADSSGLTCNTAEVTVPDPGNCNNTTQCPNIKCGSVIIQVNGN